MSKKSKKKQKKKIFKTLLSFTDAHLGKIMQCDTIELNGKFWLVPKWIDNPSTGKRSPLRIIQLDPLPHQNKFGEADFVLNNPIPWCVFDGEIPNETTLKFVIVESPDIQFDIPKPNVLH